MFIVENGLGADTPDENGYVEDDYRIDYLAYIKAMRDAINEDGVELWGYNMGLYRPCFCWNW